VVVVTGVVVVVVTGVVVVVVTGVVVVVVVVTGVVVVVTGVVVVVTGVVVVVTGVVVVVTGVVVVVDLGGAADASAPHGSTAASAASDATAAPTRRIRIIDPPRQVDTSPRVETIRGFVKSSGGDHCGRMPQRWSLVRVPDQADSSTTSAISSSQRRVSFQDSCSCFARRK
jgi:hypothetical protein